MVSVMAAMFYDVPRSAVALVPALLLLARAPE
jgi:hypothetical protein